MHDYLLATIGGGLIGISAIVMMAFLGRVTGISGLFWVAANQLVEEKFKQIPWQLIFMFGLVLGAVIAHQLFGITIPAVSDSGTAWAIIAGLVVGFGTNLGSGCTSGHGVCGISRLSLRSVSATIVFMFFGIATVYVVKHVLGAAG